MVALRKQSTKIKKHVVGAQCKGLDGPVHNVRPGDDVYTEKTYRKDFGTSVGRTISSAPHLFHCNQDQRTNCINPSH